MKLEKMILKNFRGYKGKTEINFDNLTVLIGKNDIGKSTVLEALDIFFNDGKGTTKLDKNDSNVKSDSDIIEITVSFKDYPLELILDSTVKTSLKEEFLLNKDERLEIKKTYKNGKLIRTSLITNYPIESELEGLHGLKIKELQKKIKELELKVDDTRKSSLCRKAIFSYFNKGIVNEKEISTSDLSKDIMEKIDSYMPLYTLFQSDRKNDDGDSEVQSPLKTLLKEALKDSDIEKKLNDVYKEVKSKSEELVSLTLDKLSEMNPEIAKELKPEIKTPNWSSVFNFSLSTDEGVILNKRGSGVRRLILLNFFRAEAERRRHERNVPHVIYAFEEPESAQHPNHQKMLLEALNELTNDNNSQVILTTHSPAIASLLPMTSLRYIKKINGNTIIYPSTDTILKEVSEELGIFPNLAINDITRVKVAVCVEGTNDINFLSEINNTIPEIKEIIDLNSQKIITLPLGGSSIQYWVNQDYLEKLNINQVHIYDSDIGSNKPNKYKNYVDKLNLKDNSVAFETNLREMENYITPCVFEEKFSKAIKKIENWEDIKKEWRITNVPLLAAQLSHELSESREDWEELPENKQRKKTTNAKKTLNKTHIKEMSKEKLDSYGYYEEIEKWFNEIKRLAEI